MTTTSKQKKSFLVEDFKLASLAKALGHPARIAILRSLAEKDSCLCGEIVDDLPLAQSTVSQHLKALKEAGLIKGTVDGARSCYCIDKEKMSLLLKDLEQFLEFLKMNAGNENCC